MLTLCDEGRTSLEKQLHLAINFLQTNLLASFSAYADA